MEARKTEANQIMTMVFPQPLLVHSRYITAGYSQTSQYHRSRGPIYNRKIVDNQNGGCVFLFPKYRVSKGFQFHAQPQTGPYRSM